MRCDNSVFHVYTITFIVSIPVGFSDALRPTRNIASGKVTDGFQSLLGFLMRCDQSILAVKGLKLPFQSLLGFLMRCDHITTAEAVHVTVSIPVGFSDALRHTCSSLANGLGVPFQSLLGFLMRCDRTSRRISSSGSKFQSLLGFLMRCDFKLCCANCYCESFNPCWVF